MRVSEKVRMLLSDVLYNGVSLQYQTVSLAVVSFGFAVFPPFMLSVVIACISLRTLCGCFICSDVMLR